MIINETKPKMTELQYYEVVQTIADVGKDYDDYRSYNMMCNKYGKHIIDHIASELNLIYLNLLREKLRHED